MLYLTFYGELYHAQAFNLLNVIYLVSLYAPNYVSLQFIGKTLSIDLLNILIAYLSFAQPVSHQKYLIHYPIPTPSQSAELQIYKPAFLPISAKSAKAD